MKVLKFGGTSVGSAERMKLVADLLNEEERRIVVLSATSGTTNQLVELSNSLYKQDREAALKLLEELREKHFSLVDQLYNSAEYKTKGKEMIDAHCEYIESFTRDMFTQFEERSVLAQGELLSTALFQYYLEELGRNSILLSALDFMKINKDEEPDRKYIESHIEKELKKYPGDVTFITQGYICRNAFGEVDNLKRGGSDYSASLIGASINAEEIQIWTDIDGMHNNDPRVVENTFPIAELSFNEAAELAYFGAKILHPSSIRPARDKNIPVRLLNTMDPSAKGTIISSVSAGDNVKAVAAKDGITAIKIRSGQMLLAYGFMRSIFEVFERYRTPIDMITTSEVAVSVTIDDTSKLDEIVKELQEFSIVEVDYDQTIVCIVGDFLGDKYGYAVKIFDALKNVPIRMISYGGSKNNVSLLISSSNKTEALNALQGLFTGKEGEDV